MDDETVILTAEFHVMAEGTAAAIRRVMAVLSFDAGPADLTPIAMTLECGGEYKRIAATSKCANEIHVDVRRTDHRCECGAWQLA